MKWPRLMLAEVRIAVNLLFQPGSWLADKHLRKGFMVAVAALLPTPFLLFALLKISAPLAILVAAFEALVANLVWLGIAAESRDKERRELGDDTLADR